MLIAPAYLAADIADLRIAYQSDDALFAEAIVAVADAIKIAIARREKCGTKLIYGLHSYYRAKFQSQKKPRAPADLRLIFRPVPGINDVEIVAFGHRHKPQSVYLTGRTRVGAVSFP